MNHLVNDCSHSLDWAGDGCSTDLFYNPITVECVTNFTAPPKWQLFIIYERGKRRAWYATNYIPIKSLLIKTHFKTVH